MRVIHQERAATLKRRFHEAGLPVMESDTHIVPVFVGDPVRCKMVSDMLLADHGVYVQADQLSHRTARDRAAGSLHSDALPTPTP